MAIIYTTHIRDSISIPFHSPWSYVNIILLLGVGIYDRSNIHNIHGILSNGFSTTYQQENINLEY